MFTIVQGEARSLFAKLIRIVSTSVVVLLLALLNFVNVAPAQDPDGPDVVVDAVEFVPDRESQGVTVSGFPRNAAVVGDEIKLRAVVHNDKSVAAGRIRAEFYYIEETTEESSFIGEAGIFGLQLDEVARPAVTWDTSDLTPGKYQIRVRVVLTEQEDEDTCNNTIPRNCDGDVKEALPVLLFKESDVTPPQSEYITPARPWPFVRAFSREELEETGAPYDFALARLPPTGCVMGEAIDGDIQLNVQCMSLGFSEFDLEKLDIMLKFSSGPNEPLLTTKRFRPKAAYPGRLGMGETGLVNLKFSYGDQRFDFLGQILESEYEDPEKRGQRRLGVGYDLELHCVLAPGGAEIILPKRGEFFKVYTPVDLWTFPVRASCDSSQEQEGVEVKVPPTIGPDGIIYHIVWHPDGDILYALKSTGEKHWEKTFNCHLTPVAVRRYEEDGESTIIYVGTDDGHVYAIKNERRKDLDEPGTKIYRPESYWEVPGIGAVTSKPYVTRGIDGALLVPVKVLVGTEKGVYVIEEIADGVAKPQLTINKGPVKQTPLYNPKTSELWFATGSTVYRAKESGSITCSYNTILPVSTQLRHNEDWSVIYFGTERGELWKINAQASGCPREVTIDFRNPIRGLAVARDGDTREDNVFLTTEDGYVRICSEKATKSEDCPILNEDDKLISIRTDPAILVDGGKARGVFVTSRYGRMIGLYTDHDEYLRAKMWGWPPDEKFTTGPNGTYEKLVPYIFETVPGEAMTAPIIAGEKLLVGSEDGYLYAFSISRNYLELLPPPAVTDVGEG